MLKLLKSHSTKYFATLFIASSAVVFTSQLYAAWGPDSPNYKMEAPLVGTWVGQVSGKPIEFALWPNNESNKLSGVMVWGNCTAGIQVAMVDTSSAKKEKLFSFNSFLLGTEEIKSRCPESGRPGYDEFYLQPADDSEKLMALTRKDSSTLTQEPKTLSRGTPSRFLLEALEYLTNSEAQYTLSAVAKASISDPSNNFLNASTLFNQQLSNIENHYYVSELGGVYRFDDINEGEQGQFYFYLTVVDLGPHNSKLIFESGDNAGSGEFNPTQQNISISLFDQSEQCGIIRKPPSLAKIIPEINSPSEKSLTTSDQKTPITWILNSRGACTAYQFYGECNPKECDRWLRDQISNPNIKAILTDDIKLAERQATFNASAISLVK